jgi:hypothetical protein
MFLLSAMSTSRGPVAVPDIVKTKRQLTFICLVVFVSRFLLVLGVENMEEKTDDCNEKIQRFPTSKLEKFRS